MRPLCNMLSEAQGVLICAKCYILTKIIKILFPERCKFHLSQLHAVCDLIERSVVRCILV